MTGMLAGVYRRAFLAVAASFIILGMFRLFDRGNEPYDGYATDGSGTVIQVDGGGPAGRAGLKAGDRIRSVDGIPAEDTRARARRARPAIGESTTLEVERGGAGASDAPPSSFRLSFTHAAPPGNFAAMNTAGFLIGLCFVLCGLAACFKVPSRSGRILALAGLCLGSTFLGFPYSSSYSVRLLAQAVMGLVLVLGFASLFHFLLEFPRPKAFLRRKYALSAVTGCSIG
jgi:membrane-associated protease RseP (regulator of RpoE activity)